MGRGPRKFRGGGDDNIMYSLEIRHPGCLVPFATGSTEHLPSDLMPRKGRVKPCSISTSVFHGLVECEIRAKETRGMAGITRQNEDLARKGHE